MLSVVGGAFEVSESEVVSPLFLASSKHAQISSWISCVKLAAAGVGVGVPVTASSSLCSSVPKAYSSSKAMGSDMQPLIISCLAASEKNSSL